MTKRQIKDNERIMAWIKGEEFKENSRAKPAVPELDIEDVLNGFTPAEQTNGAKFYTPVEMSQQIFAFLPIANGVKVLEPAAGIGNLVYVLIDYGVDPADITAYDLDQTAVVIGQGLFPDVTWVNDTPLDYPNELTGQFDIVAMNPPFNCPWGTSKGIAMAEGRCKKSEHLFLELAIRAAKPGGIIAAIAPYNYIDRLPKKARAFFDQYVESFDDIGELPGTFNGTGYASQRVYHLPQR